MVFLVCGFEEVASYEVRAALDGERFAAVFGRRLAEAVGERYGRVVCAGGATWGLTIDY